MGLITLTDWRILAGMRGLLSLALMVAGGTAPGAAASDDACRLPAPSGQWHQVTSKHFTVLGNTSAKVAASACLHLERTLEALAAVTPMRLDAGAPITVLIFSSERTFDPIRSALTPGPGLLFSSLYSTSDFGRVIVAHAGVAVVLETSLAHEVAHALVRTTIPRPPYWLDEGLAEFYETAEVHGSTLRIGMPIQEHVYRLRKKRWWSFEELLTLHGDAVWNEVSDRRGQPTSEAWALVHYLLLGNPQRAGQLARYLTAIQDGIAAGPAFGAAFGVTPAALQTEVLGYVQGPSHPFVTYKLAESGVSGVGTSAEVPRADALAEIGRFLAFAENPPHGTAECYLAEALRLDPEPRLGQIDAALASGTRERLVALEAALAERLLREGRTADAVVLLRTAISLATDEATRRHLSDRAAEAEGSRH